MANLGLVEAFAKFDAKLVNSMWAVSAIADDGALVISCWANYFKKGDPDVVRYVDSLSRWTRRNGRGKKLLETHLLKAFAENLPVRMVVATAADPEAVEREPDASKFKKTFHIRDDLIGHVTEFDGDRFVIEFRRSS